VGVTHPGFIQQPVMNPLIRKYSNPNFEPYADNFKNPFQLRKNTFTYRTNTPNVSNTTSTVGSNVGSPMSKPHTKKRSNNNVINLKSSEDNTEILKINIYCNEKLLTMSLKRFDDLYVTTKNFFESNCIPDRLIKPIVYRICEAMRGLFETYNKAMKPFDSDYLFSLRKLSEKYINNNEEVKKDRIETEELDISCLSAMSLDESAGDLSFFKLNKSF
jgi:hypothetical protein